MTSQIKSSGTSSRDAGPVMDASGRFSISVVGEEVVLVDGVVSLIEAGVPCVATRSTVRELSLMRADLVVLVCDRAVSVKSVQAVEKHSKGAPFVILINQDDPAQLDFAELSTRVVVLRMAESLTLLCRRINEILSTARAEEVGSLSPASPLEVPLSRLSGRESQVLRLLVAGDSDDSIANVMGLSVSTVRTHVRNLCRKLEVKSRADAVALSQFGQRQTVRRYNAPSVDRSGTRGVLLVTTPSLRGGALASSIGRMVAVRLVGLVHDGTIAAERVRKIRPDLVVVDDEFPTAMEVCADLHRSTGGVKCLFFGAGSDWSRVVEVMAAGADGYCPSSVSSAKLTDAIHRVAAGDGFVPPGMLGKVLRGLREKHVRDLRQITALANLTKREREVLDLISSGVDEPSVSEQLFISLHTTRSHIQNLTRKLNVHSRAELLALGAYSGNRRS